MTRVRRNLVVLCCMLIALPALAQNSATQAENKLKGYFSSVALQVKKERHPAEKREILNRSFARVFKAVDEIESMRTFSSSDLQAIAELRRRTQEKFDELNGLNNYQPVSDAQLNHFADYVVQDLEQAKPITVVTMTTVLIIVLLVLLLGN